MKEEEADPEEVEVEKGVVGGGGEAMSRREVRRRRKREAARKRVAERGHQAGRKTTGERRGVGRAVERERRGSRGEGVAGAELK